MTCDPIGHSRFIDEDVRERIQDLNGGHGAIVALQMPSADDRARQAEVTWLIDDRVAGDDIGCLYKSVGYLRSHFPNDFCTSMRSKLPTNDIDDLTSVTQHNPLAVAGLSKVRSHFRMGANFRFRIKGPNLQYRSFVLPFSS